MSAQDISEKLANDDSQNSKDQALKHGNDFIYIVQLGFRLLGSYCMFIRSAEFSYF